MSLVRYEVKQEHQDKLKDWYENDKYRTFIISGYAGCGKTTLARSVPDVLGLKSVSFLAPTGKAALLLQGGQTIHSYLYKAIKDKETGQMIFIRKSQEEFVEDLLIVDEISMVSDDLMSDLKSVEIPIIGLGDPAQLPPVGGDNSFLTHADIFLTEVFRNDGGILALATDIREGRKLKYKYADVRLSSRKMREDISQVTEDTIIICRFNKTRQLINSLYREEVKKYIKFIEIGEKLIVLRNNKQTGLMNGSVVIVKKIKLIKLDLMQAMLEVDNNGQIMTIIVELYTLLGKEKPRNNFRVKDSEDLHDVDYAYAITCHKAQGSEFEKVFVVNEGSRFEDQKEWLYTAVTRAKKELRIYPYA